MYPEIKNKATQALENLRIQIILILDFILNEMYPTIRNELTRLLNNPRRRVILLIVVALVVVFVIGIGNDYGG